MTSGAKDYRDDYDVTRLISKDKRTKERQQLKLQIASQCIEGILANNSEYNMNATNLAKFAWDVATELVKLSEQEEKVKRSLWHKEEEKK